MCLRSAIVPVIMLLISFSVSAQEVMKQKTSVAFNKLIILEKGSNTIPDYIKQFIDGYSDKLEVLLASCENYKYQNLDDFYEAKAAIESNQAIQEGLGHFLREKPEKTYFDNLDLLVIGYFYYYPLSENSRFTLKLLSTKDFEVLNTVDVNVKNTDLNESKEIEGKTLPNLVNNLFKNSELSCKESKWYKKPVTLITGGVAIAAGVIGTFIIMDSDDPEKVGDPPGLPQVPGSE